MGIIKFSNFALTDWVKDIWLKYDNKRYIRRALDESARGIIVVQVSKADIVYHYSYGEFGFQPNNIAVPYTYSIEEYKSYLDDYLIKIAKLEAFI